MCWCVVVRFEVEVDLDRAREERGGEIVQSRTCTVTNQAWEEVEKGKKANKSLLKMVTYLRPACILFIFTYALWYLLVNVH